MEEIQPRRRSRDELRSLLLSTGGSILKEEGLRAQPSAVTFKRVFDRVAADTGVVITNASVIRRLWENQEDYQTDVMVTLASDLSRSKVDDVARVIAGTVAGLDLSTPEARRAALAEICRVAAEAHGYLLRHSDTWTLWMTLWSMATSSNLLDRHDRVLTALMDGYAAVNAEAEERFAGLMTSLGFRMREGMTIRHLMNAAGALAEGCSLRDRVDSELLEIPLPTGPDGEKQDWTIYGLGLRAITNDFFEEDPRCEANADTGPSDQPAPRLATRVAEPASRDSDGAPRR